jgi:WS/DGAT/MGAT family acyltransferase
MAQRHMDRLSAVDAGFLHQEGTTAHMHIGALCIFEGPPPGHDELIEHMRRRLPRVPRYRQKLAFPPLQTGRPLWVDDPNFNLDYHVRHTALPTPGDEEQLLRLVSRIVSQRLDRGKPLWELWLVEGLQQGRFALVNKTHHSLVDGVSGAELLTVLFDVTPQTDDGDAPPAWTPQPEPGALGLIAAGVRDAGRRVLSTAGATAGTLVRPAAVASSAVEMLQGLGEVASATLHGAPPSVLNVPIGPHRRFLGVRARLDDMKAVKNAFGGTVNDVVLAVVAGGVQRFLRSRGEPTQGRELRALVPVSTRGEGGGGVLGNQLTVMLAPLPVGVTDPVERLHRVSAAMAGLKESKQALGAQVITEMQSFAPPTILAQASRLGFSSRMYNLLVTNVPGPQFPVYLRGREMLEMFPIPFLAADHALAVAVVSYNGGIDFGLLGDYDALPDLDVVATGISESLAELVALARQGRPKKRYSSPVSATT